MGYPMAGHLALAGHNVTVYNRSAGQGRSLGAEFGGHRAAMPPRRARRPPAADIVFCCVGNDDDLRSVVLGAERRLRRHEAGRRVRRPHHGFGRRGARTVAVRRKRSACSSSTPRCPAARPARRTARSP
jgi:hypothetical protein